MGLRHANTTQAAHTPSGRIGGGVGSLMQPPVPLRATPSKVVPTVSHANRAYTLPLSGMTPLQPVPEFGGRLGQRTESNADDSDTGTEESRSPRPRAIGGGAVGLGPGSAAANMVDSGPAVDSSVAEAEGEDGRGVAIVGSGSGSSSGSGSGSGKAVPEAAEEPPNERVGELKIPSVLGGGGGGAAAGIGSGVGVGARVFSGIIQPPSPNEEGGGAHVFDTTIDGGERGGGAGVDPALAPTPRMTVPGFRGPDDVGAAAAAAEAGSAAAGEDTFYLVDSDRAEEAEEEKESVRGPARRVSPVVPPRARAGANSVNTGRPRSSWMAIQVGGCSVPSLVGDEFEALLVLLTLLILVTCIAGACCEGDVDLAGVFFVLML